MFIFKYTCHVLKCLESAELMHLRVWYAEALICVKKHAFVCYYDTLSTEMLRVHYLLDGNNRKTLLHMLRFFSLVSISIAYCCMLYFH